MKSYVVHEFGSPLEPLDAPTPVPTGTEVLLEIRHCGVCHTDVHLREGSFDLGGGKRLASRLSLPHVLGHEIEGEAVAAGAEAGAIPLGSRRAVFPWIGCGRCSACRRGEENICLGEPRQLGCSSGCAGGYATHVVIPHPRYLIDYGDVDPALAAACMCSGLTAFAALRKAGPLTDGERLLIIGCGGVGMMGIQFARTLLDRAPLVADIDAGRRAAALGLDAAEAYDPGDKEVVERIRAATGAGPGAVIDFVGSEQSASLATRVVRRGGRVVIVGLFGGSLTLALPTIPLRGISIIGTNTGTLAEATEMMALVRAGRLQPIPMTRRPLAEADSALRALERGAVTGRVMLIP
jgi:D-arabinose 1-dehydrogenase-like Zn-dependent alcohol dehydrogenase